MGGFIAYCNMWNKVAVIMLCYENTKAFAWTNYVGKNGQKNQFG